MDFDDEVDYTDIHLKIGSDNAEALLPLERRAAITQFRVFARLRPFIQEELEVINKSGKELRSTIEMVGNKTFPLNPDNNWEPSREFEFDRSLWSIPKSQVLKPLRSSRFYDNVHEEVTNQEDMYNIATRDTNGVSMVDNAFIGINSCVLTYGQTSSGKTYTMMGKYGNEHPEEERGIIPRVCDELFTKVNERREFEAKKEDPSKRWELDVDVTFVEIYLEKVRDLLDPELRHRTHKQAVRATLGQAVAGNSQAGDTAAALAAMKEAKVRRDPYTGPFVEGIEHVPVKSWQDCVKVLERGSKHRTTAQTTVHDNSSRSHAIFTVTLKQKRLLRTSRAGNEYERRTGRINLVDLAGSERGGGTAYVTESAAINKSLMALRRVIDSLCDRQNMIFERQAAELDGKPVPTGVLPHVPYNDSVLTRLLEDSIGGNSKTVMIANMTPYWVFYEETLRTLEWCQKANKLTSVVQVVDDSDIVKKDMMGKLDNLSNALQNTRTTVEGLSAELERRQKLIANLTKKNDEANAKIAELKKEHELHREKKAAITIQLACYIHNFRQKKLRRRQQVLDAEGAADAAKSELDALMNKHETLVETLSRHNVTMGRIKEKANEVSGATDETIAKAQEAGVSTPEELKKELTDKQNSVAEKRNELLKLQKQKEDAETLLAAYQKEREDRAKAADSKRLKAIEMKKIMEAEILGEALAGGEYASVLSEGVSIAPGRDKVSLFELGQDDKWGPSMEFEDELRKLKEARDEAKQRLARAEESKESAERQKQKLRDQVATENSKISSLDKNIAQLQKQIQDASGCM